MKTKLKNGYVYVYCPDHKYSETKNGWILQHRKVVEDFIKKKLSSNACIHHLDEHKKNNDIKNLMIFKSSKEHASWHTKLKRYGYLTNPMKRQIAERWF